MRGGHRSLDESIELVQSQNENWWTTHPMTYDWHQTIAIEPMTEAWFAEMDARWIDATYPYLSTQRPFDRIMPDDLTGVRVLEIGCGMGLHTEQLALRGALVTAIDLTEPAVQATAERIRLHGLSATVRQADAESLPFEAQSFDLVWSWGVIHHSARTARIMRGIAGVLTPTGSARIMVYNRDARIAQLSLAWHYWLGRQYRTKTMDEVLWATTDGYMARYYTIDGLDDVLRGFFATSSTRVLGQEADVVPLPSRFRKRVMPMVSSERRLASASKHGGFLFSVAQNPLR